jgi:hypothetical protein
VCGRGQFRLGDKGKRSGGIGKRIGIVKDGIARIKAARRFFEGKLSLYFCVLYPVYRLMALSSCDAEFPGGSE